MTFQHYESILDSFSRDLSRNGWQHDDGCGASLLCRCKAASRVFAKIFQQNMTFYGNGFQSRHSFFFFWISHYRHSPSALPSRADFRMTCHQLHVIQLTSETSSSSVYSM